jgi:hypothetical protein
MDGSKDRPTTYSCPLPTVSREKGIRDSHEMRTATFYECVRANKHTPFFSPVLNFEMGLSTWVLSVTPYT